MRSRTETRDVPENFGTAFVRELGAGRNEGCDRLGFNDAGIVPQVGHARESAVSDDVSSGVGGVGPEDRRVGGASGARPGPQAPLADRRGEFAGVVPRDAGLPGVLDDGRGPGRVGIQAMGRETDRLGVRGVANVGHGTGGTTTATLGVPA